MEKQPPAELEMWCLRDCETDTDRAHSTAKREKVLLSCGAAAGEGGDQIPEARKTQRDEKGRVRGPGLLTATQIAQSIGWVLASLTPVKLLTLPARAVANNWTWTGG